MSTTIPEVKKVLTDLEKLNAKFPLEQAYKNQYQYASYMLSDGKKEQLYLHPICFAKALGHKPDTDPLDRTKVWWDTLYYIPNIHPVIEFCTKNRKEPFLQGFFGSFNTLSNDFTEKMAGMIGKKICNISTGKDGDDENHWGVTFKFHKDAPLTQRKLALFSMRAGFDNPFLMNFFLNWATGDRNELWQKFIFLHQLIPHYSRAWDLWFDWHHGASQFMTPWGKKAKLRPITEFDNPKFSHPSGSFWGRMWIEGISYPEGKEVYQARSVYKEFDLPVNLAHFYSFLTEEYTKFAQEYC